MKTLSPRLSFFAKPFMLLAAFLFGAAPVYAATLTDKLLAEMMFRHAPAVLYEQSNNPWPGGTYKVTVYKTGMPQITSTATYIDVNLPVKVEMRGQAGSDMIAMQLSCNAAFDTVSAVRLTSRKADDLSAFDASMTLPVPAVMAHCDGMQIPVESYIKAMVAQNKPRWEQNLSAQVNEFLGAR